MEITPGDITQKEMYKIMTGTIVPRPIGWISTVDSDGRPNVAPFSYFNAVSTRPPALCFSASTRSVNRQPKDTLANVRSTGVFVANIVSEEVAEAMNLTAQELPAGVNEFERAGLTAVPGVTVAAPRVAESPVQFECRVIHIYDVSVEPGGGSVVIGEILRVHIRDDIVGENFRIDLDRLKPVGRLVGNGYTRITDRFELIRPPSLLKPVDE